MMQKTPTAAVRGYKGSRDRVSVLEMGGRGTHPCLIPRAFWTSAVEGIGLRTGFSGEGSGMRARVACPADPRRC